MLALSTKAAFARLGKIDPADLNERDDYACSQKGFWHLQRKGGHCPHMFDLFSSRHTRRGFVRWRLKRCTRLQLCLERWKGLPQARLFRHF